MWLVMRTRLDASLSQGEAFGSPFAGGNARLLETIYNAGFSPKAIKSTNRAAQFF